MSQTSSSTFPLWAGSLAHTPFGPISVVVSERGLRRVTFTPASQIAAELAGQLGSAQTAPDALATTLQEIESYLGGCCRLFTAPLDFGGLTHFQEAVLRATLAVAYGETRSYGEIARSINQPQAARAVGAALGRNPMVLVIPCHRVVDSLGHLHGYSAPGGVETKAWLLQLEGHTLVGPRLA